MMLLLITPQEAALAQSPPPQINLSTNSAPQHLHISISAPCTSAPLHFHICSSAPPLHLLYTSAPQQHLCTSPPLPPCGRLNCSAPSLHLCTFASPLHLLCTPSAPPLHLCTSSPGCCRSTSAPQTSAPRQPSHFMISAHQRHLCTCTMIPCLLLCHCPCSAPHLHLDLHLLCTAAPLHHIIL